jgi:hypothetical protein
MDREVDRVANFHSLVDGELRAGETRGSIYPAISPNPDPGSAFLSYAALPLLLLWRRIAAKRLHQQALTSSGFPMARRMLLVPTGHRLLVWSARKGFAPDKFLGDLAYARITGAASPTVGQGWRTVVIDMADGDPVSIKVAAKNIESFMADLPSAAR